MTQRVRPWTGVVALAWALAAVSFTWAAPGDFKLTDAQVAERAGKIDELVDAGLLKAGVRPNPNARDEVFMRRVYLDTIGRVPSYDEATEYLKSRHSQRRQRLIDELLASPGRASHEFNYWADVLRVVSRMENGSAEPYVQWVKTAMHNNMPYDKFVTALLTAEGPMVRNGATGYFVRDSGMPLDNASNTLRIFLGTQLACAQCHDHPFDQWTQYEFYEMAAFTYGLDTRIETDTVRDLNREARALQKEGASREDYRLGQRISQVARMLAMGVKDNGRQIRLPDDYKYSDANPREVVKPRSFIGSDAPGHDRASLAKWMTSKDNPLFAKVVANRYWKRALGMGVFEPHDEITADTKPVNPELSDYLTQLMKDLDYDLREFQRVIFNTRAYQREATRAQIKEGEKYLFPGPLLRRMTAEQVWDSLVTLAVPDPDKSALPKIASLSDGPRLDEMTARQIIDGMTKDKGSMGAMMDMMYGGGRHDGLVRASEIASPAPAGHVLERFGQSDRQLIEASSTEGSVPQVLNLMNGWIDNVLLKDKSVLYENVKKARTVKDKIDCIWISILGRDASPADRSLAMGEIKAFGDTAFNNLVWAMLNSREFLFIQ